MLDLIWNLFQDSDIDRLRADVAEREAQASSQQEKAGSTEARLFELERRHEQLKLVTLSLWRLLQDRMVLTDEELTKYVKSTDLLDGTADGVVDLTKGLIECRKCGHSHFNTAVVCPYCGIRRTPGQLFDTA